MNVKAKFTPAEVAAELQKKITNIEAAIVNRLASEGEKFVRNARSINTYKDQTGNLRSSIGYVILKDGRQISGSFPGSSSEGRKIGKDTADRAAKKHNKGYVLIVVAGMDYAHAVESGIRKKPDGTWYSVRNKHDVLTNSSITASESLTQALKKLTEKIK